MDVPGSYILVDHAIFRAIDKGAVAILGVTGNEVPSIFKPLKLTVADLFEGFNRDFWNY